VLTALLLAATASQARSGSTSFIYEQDRLYVPLSAASGRPLGQFILDTGSAKTLVDAGLQSSLALRAGSARSERGAGRGRFDVAVAGPIELRTGNVTVRAKSVEIGRINALLAPYAGRRIGGILGGDLFRNRIVTIDFQRNRVSVRPAAGFRYRGNGHRVPFDLVGGVPIARGTIELRDGTRIPLRLLIDLGAKANLLLATPFVTRYGVSDRLGPKVVEPLGAGLGGETRYAFARLTRLQVGHDRPVSADGLIIGMSVANSLRGDGYDGLLGARFLRRFRLILDYPRSEMILEPRAGFSADGFDRSGAFIVTDGDLHRFIVSDVVRGSPADGAGLRKDDVILELNGRPARRMSLAEVREVLSSPDTPVARFKVQRETRIRALRAPLRNLL
jgi:hypothetical protein